MRRHTKQQPCAVCGGSEREPRGQAKRCWGFSSDDGAWVRCTRPELAGNAKYEEASRAWVHRIGDSGNGGPSHDPARPLPIAEYLYADEEGKPLYKVVRYLPKSFSQARWDVERNEWLSGPGCMEGVRRVLYRLPELLESQGPVLIVEGEKDVETALRMEIPATCNVGGAGAGKWRDEYNKPLEGRKCVIVPDQDEGGQGEKHAQEIAASLKRSGIEHRIVDLPGGVKDLSAWVDKGASRDQILDLVYPKPDWSKSAKSPILSAEEILATRDIPIPYILEPLLIRGSLTQLHGPPKMGKSTFALYLAVCAAYGVHPRSDGAVLRAHSPARVLYLSWEDQTQLVARRICDYSAGLEIGSSIPVNFFFSYAPEINLGSPSDVDLLDFTLRENSYEILVIDTISYVHTADENSASEIKPVMSALRQLAYARKAAIFYVHHSRKAKDGVVSSERARGSTAISAAAEVLIDWGERIAENTTSVQISSKWGRSGTWTVEYIPQPDGSIKWVVDEPDKPLSRADRKQAVLTTVRDLCVSSPAGPDGCSIVKVMKDQGIGRSSTYDFLRQLCEENKLVKIVSGNATLYALPRV